MESCSEEVKRCQTNRNICHVFNFFIYIFEMVWDELECRVKEKQPMSPLGTPSRLLENHSR